MASPYVETGDLVQLEFIEKDQNENIIDTSMKDVAQKSGIFDSNKIYAPLSFKVGTGHAFAGLEEGVLGMRLGQSKTIVIPPQKAYGVRDPNLISLVPIEVFTDNGITPKEGMTIKLTEGGSMRVLRIQGNEVQLDTNHPMAGQTLVFEVTLVRLTKGR